MYQCHGCGHLTNKGRQNANGHFPTKRCPACRKKRIFFWVPSEEEIEQACTGILFAEQQSIQDGTYTGGPRTRTERDCEPETWTPQEIVVLKGRQRASDGRSELCDCPYWNHEH